MKGSSDSVFDCVHLHLLYYKCHKLNLSLGRSYIVGTLPFCRGGGGRGLSLQPNFQQKKKGGGGGLTGPQLLERGCWERGG